MGKLSEEILSDLKGKKAGPPSPVKAGGGPPVPFGGKKPGGAAEDAADGGADDAEEGDGAYAGDEESIAGDIADAVKSGDNAAVAEGLRSFIEACYPQLAKG